jgi:hypothetical protein
MLILGEIRTCLLQNSGSVRETVVSELLRLIPGEPVWMSERPMAHAVSPDLITGVDCQLPTKSGARSRGVGTVSAHAVITAGRVLQGSAAVRLERGEFDRRQPWSHYLSRPGVVELIGKVNLTDTAKGFVAQAPVANALDLGAVSDRVISKVQLSRLLDHVTPFRSTRTTMRWSAVATSDISKCRAGLTVENKTVRTLELVLRDEDLPDAARFCEDVALHDWVLTTLVRLIDRSDLGSGQGSAAMPVLRAAVDHLLHVWMPGAHVPDSLLPLWEGLERRPGFSRQWNTTSGRVRDQLAMAILTELGGARTTESGETQRPGGVGVPS